MARVKTNPVVRINPAGDRIAACNFSFDGHLISAPIVIDNAAIIGSSSGNVYALDARNGDVLWSGSAGASIDGPDEQNATILTGLGAGDGYLVVLAGKVLSARRLVP
jgi:outer membrane protein assembly factor BamB